MRTPVSQSAAQRAEKKKRNSGPSAHTHSRFEHTDPHTTAGPLSSSDDASALSEHVSRRHVFAERRRHGAGLRLAPYCSRRVVHRQLDAGARERRVAASGGGQLLRTARRARAPARSRPAPHARRRRDRRRVRGVEGRDPPAAGAGVEGKAAQRRAARGERSDKGEQGAHSGRPCDAALPELQPLHSLQPHARSP